MINVFNSFPIIWVMTRGGPGYPTDTTTTFMYKIAFRSQDIGQSAAMAVVNFADHPDHRRSLPAHGPAASDLTMRDAPRCARRSPGPARPRRASSSSRPTSRCSSRRSSRRNELLQIPPQYLPSRLRARTNFLEVWAGSAARRLPAEQPRHRRLRHAPGAGRARCRRPTTRRATGSAAGARSCCSCSSPRCSRRPRWSSASTASS